MGFIKWWLSNLFRKPNKGYGIYNTLKCRICKHPGIVWYNPSGLEPNMHCIRCGDDLG